MEIIMDNDIITQAKELLAEGKIEESLALVKTYWLENPDDAEAATLFSDLMKESGRSELSKRLNALAEQLPRSSGANELTDIPTDIEPLPSANTFSASSKNTFSPLDTNIPPLSNPDASPFSSTGASSSSNSNKEAPLSASNNPPLRSSKSSSPQTPSSSASGKELFEAGYSLIDARQHELAAMLLNRAVRLAPQEPTVNYELGFALMSMKRFEQAIPHLEQALGTSADFDTLLNLLVCYTLTRQLSKAHEMLAKMSILALDQEQKREVSLRLLALRRLESLRNKNKLNARDWLYALYGSVLLRLSTQQDKTKEDPQSIGQMLAIFKGVLDGLSALPEVIEFYGPQSRPLAQALAEFLEVPISSYKGPEQSVQAILVMSWASDIIGPHKSFTTKEKNRALFSYGLTWNEPLPVVPEVVGTLGFEEPMPWDENRSKAILAHARDLESDPRTIKSVQDALDYYDNKRQHLVLCNPDIFAYRPEYTAEVID